MYKLDLKGSNCLDDVANGAGYCNDALTLIAGPTDSNKAREEAPDSVRAKFGTDNQRNAAHGSDSTESAARELAMMFA